MMAMQSEMQVGRLNSSETLSIQSREINNRLCDTVDAKELHAFLGVGRDFSNWIKARINRYDFDEGFDYILVEDLSSPNLASSKARIQKVKNYFITLDMAKEIAMVECNEKGREARRYFIECEHQLRSNATPAIEDSRKPRQAISPTDSPVQHAIFEENSAINYALQEKSKYKMLNDMILTMGFIEDTLVLPAADMIEMIKIVRASQQKIDDLISYSGRSDRVNRQIEKIKALTNRGLLD